MTNISRPQGLPRDSGRTFPKRWIVWARGECSHAFDRVRLRVLHLLGICLLTPFDGSEQYTKWHALQTLYLLSAFCILPSSGKYVLDLIMLFISVRTGKDFVKVLNQPIFYLQGTYPVSINVLAVTTQSYESSGVLPVVQSVK
jgi:hypothetical protein